MPGGFVICEYAAVKRYFPEFSEVMRRCRDELISQAQAKWRMSFGGLAPKSGEFGETTILPALFKDNTGTRLTTWRQYIASTGSQTLLTGVGSGGTIPEDFMVGVVGLAFLEPVLRVTEIKLQISDTKLPRINLEEAMAYEQPAIIFEDYYILDEETSFELVGYVEAAGYQSIKLIGVQVNRVPNKLQVTATGAAVT